ncbi:MAG: alpha/beta hydrolase [Rhizobiaceae bacterium]
MSRDAYRHLSLPGPAGGPLVLAFHGTGADENQLAGLARELWPDAAIVAPRGDVSEFGAARFFRRTGEGVYDMDDLARATAKMAGFVQAHAEATRASTLFGIGYSNGANILASVLFEHPGLFGAVVLMHPLIPFAPAAGLDLAGTRVLVTAGRRDPICPPNLTTRLEAHLRAAEADVTLEWHEGGHELRPNEIDAARRFLAATKQDA